MRKGKSFSGYQWSYFSSLEPGPVRSRAESFLSSVDWQALTAYAASKRQGTLCSLLPDIGLGYNHMVRILEFTDGVKWVARLRLPALAESSTSEEVLEAKSNSEFRTMSLLQQRSDLPVPRVHAYEARSDCNVKASFMLMDCLEGNVGMDLGLEIPPKFKQTFLEGLANIHVKLSTILLPQIGTIVSVNTDGSCVQGPIPGLGGPYNTATEFFQAWAETARFGMTDEKLRRALGPYADEIIPSVSAFPGKIGQLATRISVQDHGPSTLSRRFWSQQYHYWETSFAAPWEFFADFPLTLSVVPPAMDAPWNYNDDGSPKDVVLAQKFADQEAYVQAVIRDENKNGGENHRLSKTLKHTSRQHLATGMRLYQDGKAG